jgi:SAM-dependent methyltransferase
VPEPERRRRLAGTFDRVAATYRDARPGYPPELFALLVERCGLGAGSAVLEIGAGTGEATIPLLRLGAHVTAVEPGTALVRELLARTRGHRLVTMETTFEDALVPDASFDIVTSATAFHWVDPALGVPKAAQALRDRGWLAVWSNVYGDPERPDPFHEAIQPLLRAHAPELTPPDVPHAGGVSRPDAEKGHPDFGEAEEHVFRWEATHDPDQIRALFSTFSSWIALPVERREPLLDALHALARDEFAGRIVRPYRTVVRLRRRTARSPRSG